MWFFFFKPLEYRIDYQRLIGSCISKGVLSLRPWPASLSLVKGNRCSAHIVNKHQISYLLATLPPNLTEAIHYLNLLSEKPSTPAPLSPNGEIENACSFIGILFFLFFLWKPFNSWTFLNGILVNFLGQTWNIYE